MEFLKKGWLIFAILLAFISTSFSQDVVQDFGKTGSVNWSGQILRATGIGAPNAKLPQGAQRAAAIESAKRVALRNILENIKGMAISSEVTIENAMISDDVIYNRVQGVVRNFKVMDIRYMSTGDIEVDVEMPIVGAFSDLLLPKKFGGGKFLKITQPLCPCCGQPWPEGKPVPEGTQLIMPASNSELIEGEKYSGLIVDTRGLNVQPAMAPKILNENMKEIYGELFINRTYAVEIGVVGYAKDIDTAKRDERVKDNPVVIKAVNVSGPNNSDVIISNTDALMIHAIAEKFNFMQRCRVIFLVD
jgi:hypothetical protein